MPQIKIPNTEAVIFEKPLSARRRSRFPNRRGKSKSHPRRKFSDQDRSVPDQPVCKVAELAGRTLTGKVTHAPEGKAYGWIEVDINVEEEYKKTFFHFSQIKGAKRSGHPVQVGDKVTLRYVPSKRNPGKFTAVKISNVTWAEERKRRFTVPTLSSPRWEFSVGISESKLSLNAFQFCKELAMETLSPRSANKCHTILHGRVSECQG